MKTTVGLSSSLKSGTSPDTRRLSANALRVLQKRYLAKDEYGKVVETPEEMFRRVAHNLAQADALYGSTPDEVQATEEKFCELMARLDFLPNSPTLMNAGRP
jgi:ribonucleoside-diphosphate reductase alpha chain